MEDGGLDRKKLGAMVFSDAEKKQTLDRLMHTRILELIHERILQFREKSEHAKVIFIDAPLLFETGLSKSTDEIWVIDVDDETRICRIMARDGLQREEILKRIESPDDKRREKQPRRRDTGQYRRTGVSLQADRRTAEENIMMSEI